MTERLKTEPNGVRDATGRFLPGNKLSPGRKRRPDAYFVAAKLAEERGIDLEKAIGEVLLAAIEAGKTGDMQAAKLALDHLCMAPAKALSVGIGAIGEDGEPVSSGHVVPPTENLAADLQKLAELAREHLGGAGC